MNRSNSIVIRAMGAFGGVKVLSILCSLVRNKLIALWVGPVGLGLVILFNSVSDLVSTASRLNIDQSAIRDLAGADARQHAPTAVAIQRWSVFLGVVGMVLMCAFSPLLSIWSFGDTHYWWAFCVLSVMPLAYSMSTAYQAIMQGSRRFGSYVRVQLVTVLAGIVVAIPLIWFLRSKSILWVIVTYGMVMLIASYLFRIRLPSVSMSRRQFWNIGSSFIRLGAFITFGSVLTYLANYAFVIFLRNYADTAVLGLYQSGSTIILSYVGVLFTGLWIEFYPRLASMTTSRHRTSVTVSHRIVVTSLILMPTAALFISLDKLLVWLVYSSEFLGVLPYLTIGMTATVLRAASWCLGLCILARGDGRIYIVTEGLSALISLTLNIVGYMLWGFAGLGLAFVLWYACYLAIVWVVYKYRYKLSFRSGVMPLMWMAFGYAVVACVAKIFVGWWLPLLMGIAIAPYVLRRLKTGS